MKTYTEAEFLSADLNIRSVDRVYLQDLVNWGRPDKIARIFDGIVYFISGKIEYEFGDISFSAQAGDVLRLPRGIPYSGRGVYGPYCFIIVDFTAEPAEVYEGYPLPYVCHPRDPASAKEKFDKLLQQWNHPSFCHQMELKTGILGILSLLTGEYAQDVCRYDDMSRILQITEYLRGQIPCASLRMEQVAEKFHISQSQLRRMFSAELGMPPAAYLSSLRLERAKGLLASRPDLSVEQISAMSGYGSVYYFSNTFRRGTGMTPTEYRKRHRTSV